MGVDDCRGGSTHCLRCGRDTKAVSSRILAFVGRRGIVSAARVAEHGAWLLLVSRLSFPESSH